MFFLSDDQPNKNAAFLCKNFNWGFLKTALEMNLN